MHCTKQLVYLQIQILKKQQKIGIFLIFTAFKL